MSKNSNNGGQNRAQRRASNSQPDSKVVPAVSEVSNNSNNVSKGQTIMANNTPSIADLFSANEASTKSAIKNGTAGLGEFRALLKKINAEKKVVKVNAKDLIKQAKDNKIMVLQIKQHRALMLLEIDAKYEDEMSVFEQYTIENAETVAVTFVEKSTKYVAPVTRGGAEAVRSIGKTLFGFGKNK